MNPKWSGLVNSIVQNPQAHIVSREVKMEATIDVMCKNLDKRHSNAGKVRVLSDLEINKGYGEGRKMGD